MRPLAARGEPRRAFAARGAWLGATADVHHPLRGLACLLVVLLTCTVTGVHANRPGGKAAAPQEAGAFGAQPTVDAAFSTYLRALEQRVKDPGLGVYSPETRKLLGARRITDGQQRSELAEIQAVYAGRILTERGDLAVIRFSDARRVPPYFFRRQPAGWMIDLAATSRVIGFDRSNQWYVRDPNSEFAFGL